MRFYNSHPLTPSSRVELPIEVPIARSDPPNDEAATPILTPVTSLSSSLTEVNWQESCLSRSKVKATRSFIVSFQREGILGSRPTYDFAGLSHDCQFAFWYNENKISVFPLGGLKFQSTQDMLPQIFNIGQEYTNGELIFDVVMSQRFLVVATSQCVRVIDIRNSYKIEAISHGEWEPGGVACHENETQFIVALGQGQGNSLRYSKGRVLLCKYNIDSHAGLSLCSTSKLPTQDRPKRVSLDADGRLVTCVTTIQNQLLLWELDEHYSAPEQALDFSKNHSSVVSTPNTISPRHINTQYFMADYNTTGALRDRHYIHHFALHYSLAKSIHPCHDFPVLGTPPQRRRMVLQPPSAHFQHTHNTKAQAT